MITYIDTVEITNKRVLLLVDYNIDLTSDRKIVDDLRITQSLPTIHHLLNNHNRIVIISHFGNPQGRDTQMSLQPAASHLQELIPHHNVLLVENFLSERSLIDHQTERQVIMLENIRFYPGEKAGDMNLARRLASLGDIYVNDAFGVCHRNDTSVTLLPKLLPAYGGLLLKKEIETITQITDNPQRPFVAVLGGVKITTKMKFLKKLVNVADTILIGGGIANTFLFAKGDDIGDSLHEESGKQEASELLKNTPNIILPIDTVIENDKIMDIGPKTQEKYTEIISKAKTIIWNGPMGYIEDERFRKGTDAIYNAIINTPDATSIIGGGETTAAIAKHTNNDKITHISTGGGAMLEFIEKGTLPGLEALKSD